MEAARRAELTSRAPFLNKTYSAYFHRDIPEEDTKLTHVGPGTPGGEYLRRFWQPVIYTEELTGVPGRHVFWAKT